MVDQQVVEMQFDNGQFEAGVRDTMESLDKLQRSLQMDGATEGMKNLQKASSDFTLQPMQASIDLVSNSFDKMRIVGSAAISNLTNTAVNAGKRMLAALVAPITQQGKQRALNIAQAKFQFAGLGMDIEKSMQSANDAVSGTAYGLDSAAKVASQLGASGMQAGEDMTKALRAVAGVAAMTSSSYDDIGSIFTTVAGQGRLMSYQLQQLSFRGLNAAAILGEQLGKTEAQIREMVSKGQIDFKTFYEAMDNAFGEHAKDANKTFSGAMSNVRAALARIGADFYTPYFENMKNVFNALIPVINNVHAAMKPFIADVADLMAASSGVTVKALEGLNLDWLAPMGQAASNVLRTLRYAIQAVGDAWREVFPESSADIFMAIAQSLKSLTDGFYITKNTSEDIKNTFAGLFTIVKLGAGVFGIFAKVIRSLADYIGPVLSVIFSLTGAVGGLIAKFGEFITKADVFDNVFTAVAQLIKPIGDILQGALQSITNAIHNAGNTDVSALARLGEKVSESLTPLKAIGGLVSAGFEKLAQVLRGMAPLFSELSERIAKSIDKITASLSSLDMTGTLQFLNTGFFGYIVFQLNQFLQIFGRSINQFNSLFINMKNVLRNTSNALNAFAIETRAKALMNVAIAVAILAVALIGLAAVDGDKLAGSLATVSVLMGELIASMHVIEKGDMGLGLWALQKFVIEIFALSIALNILASALKKIAVLDTTQMMTGVIAIGALAAIMVTASKNFAFSSPHLITGSASLILFAMALNTLSKAVVRMSALNPVELGKGIAGVGALLMELSIFLRKTPLISINPAVGISLLGLAASMNIFAKAVTSFGQLNPEQIFAGLFSIGVILAEIGFFAKGTANYQAGLIQTSASLIIISSAMVIFAEALSRMSSMDLGELVVSLTAFASVLGSIFLFTKLTAKFQTSMMTTSVSLAAMAGAMLILSQALLQMGSMSLEQLGIALAALAGSMTILGVAMAKMSMASGQALAIAAVCASMVLLAHALTTLGSMSWQGLAIALISLAAAFTILGVAAHFLTPAIPALFSLAASMALIGLAVASVGAGVLMISAGLASLAVSGAAAAASAVAIFSGLISLIPDLGRAVMEAILVVNQVFIDAMPAIIEGILAVLEIFTAALVQYAPEFIDAVVYIIDLLLQACEDKSYQWTDQGMKIITNMLMGIRDNIEELTEAAVDTITAFLVGIEMSMPTLVDEAFAVIDAFMQAVVDAVDEHMDEIIENFFEIGAAMCKGIAKGVLNGIGDVADAALEIGQTVLDKVKNFLGIHSPSTEFADIGKFSVLGLVRGLKDNTYLAEDESRNLGSNLIKAIKDELKIRSPSIVGRDEVGRYIVQGIAEGIKNDTSAEEAAKKKAQNIVAAFKTELDKLDLNLKTIGLEDQLWEALYGEEVDDALYAEHQAAVLVQKLNEQTQKVELAQGEWETTAEHFGESSSEAQEAYNKYLQEQIELVNLTKQLSEIEEEQAALAEDARKAYDDYIQANWETAQKLGYSMEWLKKVASEKTGYNPDTLSEKMTPNVESATKESMNAIEETFDANSEKTFGGLLYAFSDWGTQYASEMGDGFQEKFKQVMEEVMTRLSQMEGEVNEKIMSMVSSMNGAFGLGDGTPTIAPVVDLSEIEAAMWTIDEYFGTKKSISVAATTTRSAQQSAAYQSSANRNKGSSEMSKGGTVYSFTQNNYSPKALSRKEIYRDTKSQFSSLKQATSLNGSSEHPSER